MKIKPTEIPQEIITYFEENMDVKLSNEDWFISYYKDNVDYIDFRHQDLRNDKFIFTNKNNLDQHFTVYYKIATSEPAFFTYGGILKLESLELYEFNQNITFLKSKKLADKISKNINSINNTSQKKTKI